MPGALLQLLLRGQQDEDYIRQPEITFFKARCNPYANFAVESISQTVLGLPGFGKTVTCTIGREGDLLKDLRLAQEAAKAADADTPLGRAARDLYAQFVEEEDGQGRDFSAMLPRFENRGHG